MRQSHLSVAALAALLIGCGSAEEASERQPSALFDEVAEQAGVQFIHEASEGQYYIAEEMGPGGALLDADGDGDLDLYLVQGGRIPYSEIGEVTHFSRESNTFYRNEGGFFVDETDAVGLGAHSFMDTTFGVGTFDLDNDGQQEMLLVNGSVMRVERPERPENPYA